MPVHADRLRWELNDLGAWEGTWTPPPGEERTPTARCLEVVARTRHGLAASSARALGRIEAEHGTTPCTAMFLTLLSESLAAAGPWARAHDERSVDALRLVPESGMAWQTRANALMRAGRHEEATTLVNEGAGRMQHPVERLTLLGWRAWAIREAGDTARAAELARNLLAAVRRDGRPGLEAVLIMSVGAGLLRMDERAFHDRVRALALGAPDPRWRAATLLYAGQTALDGLGDPSAALKDYDAALAAAAAVPERPILAARALLFRGRALSKLGRLDEAEDDLRRSAAISEALEEPYWLAEAWHNLAHVAEGRGDFVAAARAGDRFVANASGLEGIPIRVMSHRDAGLIRWKAGWHAAADSAFEAMVRAVEEDDGAHYWAGEFHERKGRLEEALEYYRRGEATGHELTVNLAGLTRVHRALGRLDSAEAWARRHDATINTLTSVPLLPEVLLDAGRGTEALSLTRRWVAERIASGNVEGAAIALVSVADLALRAGRPGESLKAAREALAQSRSLNLTDQIIDARRLEGQAAFRLNGPEDALFALQAAADLAAAHPSARRIHDTHLALADALAAAGRREAAFEAYDRAARTVEEVTVGLTLDLARSRYRERHMAAFDGALRLALRPGSDGVRPTARGRGPAAPDPDLVLSWLQRRIAAALVLSGAEAAGEPATPPLGAAAIRARLGPAEALVAYALVDTAVAVVVVTRRGAAVHALPVRADSVRSWVERLRVPFVRAYGGRVDLARARFDTSVARRLHRSLLEPLAADLEGMETLLVVPDGALHLLPFEALVTRSPPAGDDAPAARFVLDEMDVVYLPSPRFLVRAPPPPVAPGRLLLVAYRAPGAAREVERVRRLWRGPVTVLADTAARESAVAAAMGSHDVLHFATHATSAADDPLASHLLLAPDRSSATDGLLHLSEIGEARPTGELVVLGACETLPGPLLAGEGPMGLARGFVAAGARAVVASQWPVGAATADLMDGFYDHLAAGDPPSQALRAAKLRLRAEAATSHPFHWAGFVLIRGGPTGR